MLDSLYVLVPDSMAAEVVNSRLMYDELEVPCARCSLFHVDNRNPTKLCTFSWFDERNVVFEVKSKTLMGNTLGERFEKEFVLEAVRHAMGMKDVFKPPALLAQ